MVRQKQSVLDSINDALVQTPRLGSRASRKPVMIAAASTRILPSFFTAPGEYSTAQMIGEQMANTQA